jgi:hypothetical protein
MALISGENAGGARQRGSISMASRHGARQRHHGGAKKMKKKKMA